MNMQEFLKMEIAEYVPYEFVTFDEYVGTEASEVIVEEIKQMDMDIDDSIRSLLMNYQVFDYLFFIEFKLGVSRDVFKYLLDDLFSRAKRTIQAETKDLKKALGKERYDRLAALFE